MEEGGYAGLADRRKGKPSAQRIPLATVEEVLGLYKETYFDLNIRHFHEKLREEHHIELSYTWVQKALQGAGLVAKRHKRGPHRRRRPRRPMPGMLLHIDGSKHQWLNDDRWHDLIVILDDATSETYYAQLVEEESTRRNPVAAPACAWRIGDLAGWFPLGASAFGRWTVNYGCVCTITSTGSLLSWLSLSACHAPR